MSKYIIPICKINDSRIYNEVIVARSINECKEKIMEKFGDYSEARYYNNFVKEMDKQDVLIGEITDVETY